MKQEEYLKEFKEILNKMLDTTRRKNTDYAGLSDAFANFKLIENLSGGKISVAEGIVVRITDKLQRVTNLLQREALVADEKITDTLLDLAVYSIILLIWMRNLTSVTNKNEQ